MRGAFAFCPAADADLVIVGAGFIAAPEVIVGPWRFIEGCAIADESVKLSKNANRTDNISALVIVFFSSSGPLRCPRSGSEVIFVII